MSKLRWSIASDHRLQYRHGWNILRPLCDPVPEAGDATSNLGHMVLRDICDAMVKERVAEPVQRCSDIGFGFRPHAATGKPGHDLTAIDILQPTTHAVVIKQAADGFIRGAPLLLPQVCQDRVVEVEDVKLQSL